MVNGLVTVPGELIDGCAYAHVREVAEAVRVKVKWVGEERMVVLSM
ncbi:hypothetical protein PPOP_3056 [Paenibacillus popilliae ATCC 14706]|uniref:Copper amine oxidase-like N-terminal domain-containing protein n=1 Tax=Paenibacillus popilliae ATCC 14706 TaxID=1212764 RepID=M9LC94_PAEPP|nr:hypothetical protein PPOP_3056 [Paenibacillus popilliae ATCC 14706]